MFFLNVDYNGIVTALKILSSALQELLYMAPTRDGNRNLNHKLMYRIGSDR